MIADDPGAEMCNDTVVVLTADGAMGDDDDAVMAVQLVRKCGDHMRTDGA